MRERPILFSGAMVRAILEGRKTMTRRVIKPQPQDVGYGGECCVRPYCTGTPWPLAYYARWGACWNSSSPLYCPYAPVGRKLWVRETWKVSSNLDEFAPNELPNYYKTRENVRYLADPDTDLSGKKRVSIHMPRWASRITLEVTAVRVERLQDITDEDAKAEGVELAAAFASFVFDTQGQRAARKSAYRSAFADLWEEINGSGSWEANPWVWVVEFRRVGR